jgi:hypothetical protein
MRWMLAMGIALWTLTALFLLIAVYWSPGAINAALGTGFAAFVLTDILIIFYAQERKDR